MTSHRHIVVHAVIELDAPTEHDIVVASIRSSLQAGLNGRVHEVRAYGLAEPSRRIADGSGSPPSLTEPTARDFVETKKASSKDQVVREYLHCGMLIQLYRDAGTHKPATYFAVVKNPNVKSPSGGVVGGGSSLEEVKREADARAERKAFLLARKRQSGT